MTSLHVFPSKKRIDTKQFSIDVFRDLPPGDTIADVDVSVQVFTGVDANPSQLLVGPAEWAGTVITLDLQLGNLGVVYSIIYTIETSSGLVVVTVARLAILRDSRPAIVAAADFFLSSKPYPIFFSDGIGYLLDAVSGEQQDLFVATAFSDSIDYGVAPRRGELRLPLVTYVYAEGLDYSLVPTDGLLRQALITYSYGEGMDYGVVPIDGLLRAALITTIYAEGMDYGLVPRSGTLA